MELGLTWALFSSNVVLSNQKHATKWLSSDQQLNRFDSRLFLRFPFNFVRIEGICAIDIRLHFFSLFRIKVDSIIEQHSAVQEYDFEMFLLLKTVSCMLLLYCLWFFCNFCLCDFHFFKFSWLLKRFVEYKPEFWKDF